MTLPYLRLAFVSSIFLSSILAIGLPINSASVCPDALLNANLNARTEMSQYKQENARNYYAYRHKLSQNFVNFFNAREKQHIRWLDAGSGYGLAPLGMIVERGNIHGVAINSQDAWGFLRRNSDLVNKVPTIALTLGASLNDLYDGETGRTLVSDAAKQAAVRAIEAYDALVARGVFEYRVGLVEQELPKLRSPFDLITDVFGAYFYSGSRLAILESYYDSLSSTGEGFVLFSAEDRHRLATPAWSESYEAITELEGNSRLEEFLLEKFPSIFRESVVDMPDGRYRTLWMKRDPQIAKLNLSALFEVIAVHTDARHPVPIMRQIPQLKLRRRL